LGSASLVPSHSRKALNNAGLLNLFQLVLAASWLFGSSAAAASTSLMYWSAALSLILVGLGAQGDIPS
jgi:hypothetical protein